jgi:hypothetical protein
LTGASLFGANADDSQQIVGITDVIIRDSSNNDYSTNTISRAQYWNYTVKTTSGRPTQYYFERTINPTLYLYPAADQAYTLIYYALVRMSDAGDYTNNAEIPFRFLPCLNAGLAYYISMKKAPERMVQEWNGSWVHVSEFESKHPQLEPKYHPADPQSLQYAKPQVIGATVLLGINLVANNIFQSEGMQPVDNNKNTKINSFVGKVEIAIT